MAPIEKRLFWGFIVQRACPAQKTVGCPLSYERCQFGFPLALLEFCSAFTQHPNFLTVQEYV